MGTWTSPACGWWQEASVHHQEAHDTAACFSGAGGEGGDERGWRRKKGQHLLELKLGSFLPSHYAADDRPFPAHCDVGQGHGGNVGGGALGFLEWPPTLAPNSPPSISHITMSIPSRGRMSAKGFQMISGSLRVSAPIRGLSWHCYL